MSTRQSGGGREFCFSSVKLLEQCRYGSYYEAQCGDLLCAAKIHPSLLNDESTQSIDSDGGRELAKFEQECDLLKDLSHPNIIQYLGVYVYPGINLPVLLVELMDANLTTFLMDSEETLPLHTQVNICHDIALALSFLHSNSIIHRDLSGNNVLVVVGESQVRAKVANLGMANLKGSTRRDTGTPDSDVYLPPEASGKDPEFSEKTDVFSFGVLSLQVATKHCPRPSSRVLQRRRFCCMKYLEIQSEIARRENDIGLLSQDHPLRDLILDSLNDLANQRPSASDICRRLKGEDGKAKTIPLLEDSSKNGSAVSQTKTEGRKEVKERAPRNQDAFEMQVLKSKPDESKLDEKETPKCKPDQPKSKLAESKPAESRLDEKESPKCKPEQPGRNESVLTSTTCQRSLSLSVVEANSQEVDTLMKKREKKDLKAREDAALRAATLLMEGNKHIASVLKD